MARNYSTEPIDEAEGLRALCYLWDKQAGVYKERTPASIAALLGSNAAYRAWASEYEDLNLIEYTTGRKRRKVFPSPLGVETILGLIEDGLFTTKEK